jgi:hypothetical protein
MEFKFAIGQAVGTLNGATYGHIYERVLHEFVGGQRITYYYWGRCKLPDGTIRPPGLIEGFEHELRVVDEDWTEWHLPKIKHMEAP